MRLRLASSAAALVISAIPALAFAQAVERNLPPAPEPAPTRLPTPAEPVPAAQDATPIGADLHAIVLLGPKDAVLTGVPAQAVDVSRVPRLGRGDFATRLYPFIGKPLSKKLIAEIETEIARQYRESGHPFVTVRTPVQELTGGVLQLRVIEFRVGRIEATGMKRVPEDYVLDRVDLHPGDPIDARRLSQELDRLNSNPFRRAEAIFSPGGSLGETNLDVRVVETRAWSVYGGYANSGSASTGWDRYFVGGMAAVPFLRDAVASYQLTGSSDFWFDQGPFGKSDPRYVSHGARLVAPTLPGQNLELSLSAVETNQDVELFGVHKTIVETTVGYRVVAGDWGELFAGAAAKRQHRKIDFQGVQVLNQKLNGYQAYAGWDDAWTDAHGHSALSLTLHVGLGDLDGHSGRADYLDYTNGRVSDGGAVYVNMTFDRTTELTQRLGWTTSLIAQYAGGPLPETEQFGIGGPDLVRGYTSDDGAYDWGAVLRNEVRLAGIPLARNGKPAGVLSPYVFVDAAWARDEFTNEEATPVSLGAGADLVVSRNVSVNMTGAYAASDGVRTKSGDARLLVRATAVF